MWQKSCIQLGFECQCVAYTQWKEMWWNILSLVNKWEWCTYYSVMTRANSEKKCFLMYERDCKFETDGKIAFSFDRECFQNFWQNPLATCKWKVPLVNCRPVQEVPWLFHWTVHHARHCVHPWSYHAWKHTAQVEPLFCCRESKSKKRHHNDVVEIWEIPLTGNLFISILLKN